MSDTRVSDADLRVVRALMQQPISQFHPELPVLVRVGAAFQLQEQQGAYLTMEQQQIVRRANSLQILSPPAPAAEPEAVTRAAAGVAAAEFAAQPVQDEASIANDELREAREQDRVTDALVARARSAGEAAQVAADAVRRARRALLRAEQQRDAERRLQILREQGHQNGKSKAK